MLEHVHHPGAENTAGAVYRGEGFVQFGHLPADGGFPLDQNNLEARVRGEDTEQPAVRKLAR